MVIFLVATFVLGFLADPIINLYLDPYGTIADAMPLAGETVHYGYEDEPITWIEHFTKGFASLGLLGFVKVLFGLGPWHWMRIGGGGATRTGATGRERMQQLNWLAVILGVVTVLWVSKQPALRQ